MCKPSEFACIISEQCIPISKRCNGINECQDGTDEQDCEGCGRGKFFCRKSGKCIAGKEHCDGVAQCPHGEDELLCKKSPYRMFLCESRRHQIPKENVCDGVKNCPDGSDEKYCQPQQQRLISHDDAASSNTTVKMKDEPLSLPAFFPRVEFVAKPVVIQAQSSSRRANASALLNKLPVVAADAKLDANVRVQPTEAPLPEDSPATVLQQPVVEGNEVMESTNANEEELNLNEVEQKGPELVEGDYQSGLEEFSPAFPKDSVGFNTTASSTLATPPDLRVNGLMPQGCGTPIPLPIPPPCVEPNPVESVNGNKPLDLIDCSPAVDQSPFHASTTQSANSLPCPTTNPIPLSLQTLPPSQPNPIIPTTTPTAEELASRGVHIPLKKYPFVNPWKAQSGSTGRMSLKVENRVGVPCSHSYSSSLPESHDSNQAISKNQNSSVSRAQEVKEEKENIRQFGAEEEIVSERMPMPMENVNPVEQQAIGETDLVEVEASTIQPMELPCQQQSNLLPVDQTEALLIASSTQPPPNEKEETEPKSMEEEQQILRRLSAKYGTATKELLKIMEHLLQVQQNMRQKAIGHENNDSGANAPYSPTSSNNAFQMQRSEAAVKATNTAETNAAQGQSSPTTNGWVQQHNIQPNLLQVISFSIKVVSRSARARKWSPSLSGAQTQNTAIQMSRRRSTKKRARHHNQTNANRKPNGHRSRHRKGKQLHSANNRRHHPTLVRTAQSLRAEEED